MTLRLMLVQRLRREKKNASARNFNAVLIKVLFLDLLVCLLDRVVAQMINKPLVGVCRLEAGLRVIWAPENHLIVDPCSNHAGPQLHYHVRG
jgi:hypothetical protein